MAEKNNFIIPIAIIVAGVLVAWGLMSKDDSPKPESKEKTTQEVTEEISFKAVSENDHILGNPQAEITLIEFSDIECPFCKKFYGTSKKLLDEYGKEGKLAVVFRHFPLQGHAEAKPKAIATECANKLGGGTKFWEYLDKLFAEKLPASELPNIAEQIGLDKDEFTKCLEDPAMEKLVEDDFNDGVKAGVLGTREDPGGTPYSLLITKDGIQAKIKGAQLYETVKAQIEEILAK